MRCVRTKRASDWGSLHERRWVMGQEDEEGVGLGLTA